MLKKILMILTCLFSSFLIVYMYVSKDFQVMKAQAAPIFELPKGAKVFLGTYNNKEIVWDIGNNDNNGKYVLMSSKPIEDNVTIYDSSLPTISTAAALNNRENAMLISPYANLSIAYCPVTPLKNKINTIVLNANENGILQQSPFLPSSNDIKTGGSLGLTFSDRAYKATKYWLDGYLTGTYLGGNRYNYYFNSWQMEQGVGSIMTIVDFDTRSAIPNSEGIIWDHCKMGASNMAFAGIRPFATVDKSKIMFAANISYTDDNWHNYTIDTINLNENNELNPNKLRIQSSLIASLQDIKRNNRSTQKVIKNSSVDLLVNANTGNNTRMSIILYDDAGTKILYYKLGSATQNGTNDYALDLNGIPVGKYQLAVINEEYDSSSELPVESSPISNLMPLEIVEPHKLTYTKTPQSGASIGVDYEFSRNVNAGQQVGQITVNPQGVMSLTYTIESNGDNTYQNFEINGLNGNGASNSSSLKVVIKSGALDLENGGLKAGMYKFCVSAVDANGDPSTPISDTKVCTTFNVAKTSTAIAFNDPNMTTKSISDASMSWNEIASATLTHGTKVTYSKTGGDISMIDIDSDTGEITYKGNNMFGMVKIRATVDDDPNTNQDNFNPSFVEKEIVIYREVDGNITPDTASSDINVPTFSMDKPNIKTGGTIGKIQGMLGTPDTIGGTTTTYSYAIKSDPNSDGSLFQVNASSGVIKANANLGVDTYNFVIIVSDKWSSKEIPVTVNVGMAPAENLKFYENATSNTMITSKSASLTDTGVSVYATVKGSSNNNPVTYRLKDGEPTNVIDVNPNSGAVTIKNVGTVVIVAEKQGSGGQADAITELTFTVTAGSQEFIYTDVSGNELPKSGNSYDDYSEVYGKGKTFQLYTSGNPSGSTVTYALQAGSPTDVISVDPSGLVSIYNASMNTQIGKVIVEATSHDPTGNYSDKTIELPITITKANQTISFKDVTPAQNGKGKVTPVILTQDISSNEGGVIVNDTSYYITIDPSIPTSLAWTSNGIDIEYNYDKEEGMEIPLHVEKAGNRNYNKAEANGKMRILGPDESTLTINRPGKIVYGDHFTLRSLQDDSSSSNVNYTFEVDNTIFVSSPTVKGNLAEFDALKCSDGSKINITVTRTADSEVTLSKVVTIEVLPKDINITIDDKTKQKGEENPPLTFQDFTSQLVSWNGVQDVVDSGIVKLSTTATTTSKAGSYPITGNTKEMNTTYPNYNFIFKEGKLMVDSNIDKDVDDDGKPDFNDPDGDGCPDLNIKWKDDDGNWVIINGDRDYDGIPDLNIDSDGDGTPDLNIDTDHDGKPDINLVILKKTDWKPTKCVVQSATVKEEYCTGTSAKPQINVDTDNDNIPNINIDNEGDFKPHLNISKDGKTPTVNITNVHEWNPSKDYKSGKFTYDSIGKEIEPQINIDTNGDDCPDINLDMDNDGIPDLNIDTDGDKIPDLNIDTVGDGKADANVDIDDDGMPDENIIEITEWKPDKKVGNICTMVIKQNIELEDNGVKVEKPDGKPFPPNYALKVEDVTEEYLDEIKEEMKEIIKETNEIKKVFDVKLLKDGVEIQPDGVLKVKIPYEGITNPILIRRLLDGTYEKIEYKIEGGYLVYETDELGIVSLIGDKEFNSSVQGTYTPNIGGAITGDETDMYAYAGLVCIMLGFICYLINKKYNVRSNP